MPKSSKKRTASELSDAEGDEERPPPALRKDTLSTAAQDDEPRLPAPVWGHVLDYMPYGEVRSALLICKMIAGEAVNYVRVLNFMKVEQMVGPPARRFQNAEVVNCVCLVRGPTRDGFTLCADASTRLVPFLTIFPKLRRVIAAGPFLARADRRAAFVDCAGPRNLDEIIRALVYSYLGAFKAKLLSPTLEEIVGIANGIANGIASVIRRDTKFCRAATEVSAERRRELGNANRCDRICRLCSGGPCSFCREICVHFPIREIYEDAAADPFCPCSSRIEILELLGQRRESKQVFSDHSASHFVNYFFESCSFFVDPPVDLDNDLDNDKLDVETRHLLKRLAEAGVDISNAMFRVITVIDVDGVRPVGFPDTTFDNLGSIDRMIALGFDPMAIPRKILYDGISLNASWGLVIEETTLHSLISRGFPLDPDDLVVIDRNEMNMLTQIAY